MRSLLFLSLLCFTAQAQTPTQKAFTEKPASADPKDLPKPLPPVEPKDGKLTIPLTLHPTAVKKPLSRYYLTPQYTEMKPGNRVPTFMRSYMEQDAYFSKELREKRDRLNELSLADLVANLKAGPLSGSANLSGLAYRNSGDPFPSRGRPLGDVDEGARQLGADWQIWFNLREDGIGTLLPEVQKMRELAHVLKIRMRYELGTGDFEKATYSARTFYGLASSFESHPTLIGFLVGIAIESICLEALEEMLQQPNCPNLYWSFTEIPAYVLNPRICVGGEPLISQIYFQPFTQAQEPMTEENLYKHLETIDKLRNYADPNYADPSDRKAMKFSLQMAIRATDKKKLEAARKFLVDTGTDAKLVQKLPDLQLIVTADIRQFEVLLDDVMAIQNLPHLDSLKMANEIDKQSKASQSLMADWLLPANRKIKAAHVRLQQRVAYLRTIEAIRLYAFDHDGQLPTKLADCTVPLPLDPVTGKAFEYAVKDGVATLHGGDPSAPVPGNTDPAQKPTGQTNRYYEIRVKK